VAESETELRSDLEQLLEQSAASHQRLLELVSDPAATAARVIDEGRKLEGLDGRRRRLLRALEAAIADRQHGQHSDDRSVRQIVLDALSELELPQQTASLKDYVWARARVPVATRNLAALRRDEERSWRRNPDKRPAYVVPALNPQGEPLSRWLTRSDWPLRGRVVVSPRQEDLLQAETTLALFAARERAQGEAGEALDAALARRPVRISSNAFDGALVTGALELYDQVEVRSRRSWRKDLAAALGREAATLREELDDEIESTADALSSLPREEQLWGRKAT
jgi:hypothetical protein